MEVLTLRNIQQLIDVLLVALLDLELFPMCQTPRLSLSGELERRSSIGAYEHPLNWLSTHHFQWGQNAQEVLTEKVEDANFALKIANPRTKIGPDVWVGANSVVLAGVEMNVGSVLGAGAVLTRDTEAYGIYAGNPAKLIKKRFSDDISGQLVESKWWQFPLDKLLKLEFTDITSCLRKIREFQSSS